MKKAITLNPVDFDLICPSRGYQRLLEDLPHVKKNTPFSAWNAKGEFLMVFKHK